MSEPRLRLAVLGCGQAALLAARALRELRGVSCAYASRRPERAARFAQMVIANNFGDERPTVEITARRRALQFKRLRHLVARA